MFDRLDRHGRLDPRDVEDALREACLTPLAVLETEPATNSFPRLAVRMDGLWTVWFAAAPSQVEGSAAADRVASQSGLGPPQRVLELSTTPRSRLRP